MLTAKTLVRQFGKHSDHARDLLPRLYQMVTPSATVPRKQRALDALAQHYGIASAEPARLLGALRAYYALVVTGIAAVALAPPTRAEDVLSGAHFRQHGVTNVTDDVSLAAIDIAPLLTTLSQIALRPAPPDALKGLYQHLFPSPLRHALGEYYTPDWLARLTLDRLGYDADTRLLDPTCGSGTFLTLALRRCEHPLHALTRIAGIDVNPLACLAAKANLLLQLPPAPLPQTVTLPIHCADVLLDDVPLVRFDVIAGNPPWVNWETLPASYRQQTRALWEQYGLFAHQGMDAILGKGKKDLSLLLTQVVMDRYLVDGGKIAFLLTDTVLKGSGAAAGFRRFAQGYPSQVDDLSRLNVFKGAQTRTILMLLQKNRRPRSRVPYTLWRSQARIKDHMSLATVQQKTTRATFVARPIGGVGSAWLTGKAQAIDAVQNVLGASDYQAHSNVYTGGANAVYWLRVLDRDGDTLHVENITAGAKRKVPTVTATIEADLVHPLLQGVDVRRWQAQPSAHILIVQNPQTKYGYDEAWLRDRYPLTYAYLVQFASMLRQRAAYKRYFNTQRHPFYTMFNVGAYTFKPVKVVWLGFGATAMHTAVVTSDATQPAIVGNQAMHPFIGLDDADEAHYLAACMNSAPFEYAVLSHTQRKGKSFAQPSLLQRLSLPRYRPDDPRHQRLSRLSRAAHAGTVDDEAIADAAAALWDIPTAGLADIQASLADLR
jgi:SAM-dependent methyltransferase